MASKAALTIDVTATTAQARAELDKASAAVKGYGDAADTATKQSRDVSGAIDTVGGVAGGATTGLRDMSDAVAMAGFPEMSAAMGIAAVGLESLDGAATLYKAAQEGLSKAVVFFDGVMKALRLTILTNPIFIIAAVIVAIVAVVVLLYMKCDTFREIVDAAFRAVWNVIRGVYEWVKDNWPLLLAILTGPFGIAVLLITKNWDSISGVIKGVWEWIRDNFKKVKEWLTEPFDKAWDFIKDIFDKIKAGFDKVKDIIGKIPGAGVIKSINPFAATATTAGAAPGVARAGGPGGHATAPATVNIHVTTTGLGADAPQIQRAVLQALRGHAARNGPLDLPVRQVV